MPTIPFTRFFPPNGRREPTSMVVDDETFKNWEKVEAAGFRMTVELLGNGNVSQCIEDPELGDYDIALCLNGPAVPSKLKAMLARFNPDDVPKWRKKMSG